MRVLYWFSKIRAIFLCSGILFSCSDGNIEIYDTVPAPVDLSVKLYQDYRILSWPAVPDATSYNVYYSEISGAGTNGTLLSTTKLTTYTHKFSDTCYYVVTAIYDRLESPASAEVLCGEYPAKPTNVSAVSGDGQISLSWASVSNATSYDISYYKSNDSTIVNVNGVSSPYTLTGLANNSSYYLSVSAVNDYGKRSSDTVSVTVYIMPEAPTGVSVTPSTSYNKITWSPGTDTISSTKYNIYWSTVSGAGKSGTKISSLSSPYYHYPNGTGGTVYYYVVTAVNGSLESAASEEVSSALLLTRTTVHGISADKMVRLSWNANSLATGYNLYYGTTSPVTKLNSTKVSTLLTAAFLTGLTNGTTVYFAVSCLGSAGESDLSNELALTPQLTLVAPQTFDFNDGTLQGWTGASVSGNVLNTWRVISNYGYCVTDSPFGSYTTSSNTAIFSPMIDISAISSPTLTFRHAYITETNNDKCLVEASVDAGVSWTALPSSNSYYSGSMPTFTQVTMDLSSVKSANLILRFRLQTDSSYTYDGWYIDDIVIQ